MIMDYKYRMDFSRSSKLSCWPQAIIKKSSKQARFMAALSSDWGHPSFSVSSTQGQGKLWPALPSVQFLAQVIRYTWRWLQCLSPARSQLQWPHGSSAVPWDSVGMGDKIWDRQAAPSRCSSCISESSSSSRQSFPWEEVVGITVVDITAEIWARALQPWATQLKLILMFPTEIHVLKGNWFW